jgi:type I restriction enzyme M protein
MRGRTTPKLRELGQFHTPPDVASDLVGMIDRTPLNLIDLGCGPGALALAASARWGSKLRLITMDLDPLAGPSQRGWTDDHRHYRLDLLNDDPFADLVAPATFDAAVLNPPYGRRARAPDADVECEASTARPFNCPWSLTRCRATVFTLHALRAVKLGGLVAAILPETLVTGRLAARNRALITASATLRDIAILPARTFAGTETRATMVLLERITDGKGATAPWWSPQRSRENVVVDHDLAPLGELEVDIVRGRLSSPAARRARAFHLGDFASARNGTVKLRCSANLQIDDRAARPGDILVARIGRDIPSKVVRVTTGTNVISDCVYRLRCPSDLSERIWRSLRSPAGRLQIEAGLSGLTTRVLPVEALRSLRV